MKYSYIKKALFTNKNNPTNNRIIKLAEVLPSYDVLGNKIQFKQQQHKAYLNLGNKSTIIKPLTTSKFLQKKLLEEPLDKTIHEGNSFWWSDNDRIFGVPSKEIGLHSMGFPVNEKGYAAANKYLTAIDNKRKQIVQGYKKTTKDVSNHGNIAAPTIFINRNIKNNNLRNITKNFFTSLLPNEDIPSAIKDSIKIDSNPKHKSYARAWSYGPVLLPDNKRDKIPNNLQRIYPIAAIEEVEHTNNKTLTGNANFLKQYAAQNPNGFFSSKTADELKKESEGSYTRNIDEAAMAFAPVVRAYRRFINDLNFKHILGNAENEGQFLWNVLSTSQDKEGDKKFEQQINAIMSIYQNLSDPKDKNREAMARSIKIQLYNLRNYLNKLKNSNSKLYRKYKDDIINAAPGLAYNPNTYKSYA